MKGLILKDFYIVKDSLLIQLISVTLMSIALSFNMTSTVFIVVAAASFSLFTNTTIAADKTSHWDMFSRTAPIEKEKVIRAKYFLAIILIFAGLLYGFLLSSIICLIKGEFSATETFSFMLIALGICLACTSISIPLSIIFDEKKQTLVMLFAITLPVLIFTITVMLASSIGEINDFKSLIANTEFFSGAVLFLISLIIFPKRLAKRDI